MTMRDFIVWTKVHWLPHDPHDRLRLDRSKPVVLSRLLGWMSFGVGSIREDSECLPPWEYNRSYLSDLAVASVQDVVAAIRAAAAPIGYVDEPEGAIEEAARRLIRTAKGRIARRSVIDWVAWKIEDCGFRPRSEVTLADVLLALAHRFDGDLPLDELSESVERIVEIVEAAARRVGLRLSPADAADAALAAERLRRRSSDRLARERRYG